jgi:hypothetical protein
MTRQLGLWMFNQSRYTARLSFRKAAPWSLPSAAIGLLKGSSSFITPTLSWGLRDVCGGKASDSSGMTEPADRACPFSFLMLCKGLPLFLGEPLVEDLYSVDSLSPLDACLWCLWQHFLHASQSLPRKARANFSMKVVIRNSAIKAWILQQHAASVNVQMPECGIVWGTHLKGFVHRGKGIVTPFVHLISSIRHEGRRDWPLLSPASLHSKWSVYCRGHPGRWGPKQTSCAQQSLARGAIDWKKFGSCPTYQGEHGNNRRQSVEASSLHQTVWTTLHNYSPWTIFNFLMINRQDVELLLACAVEEPVPTFLCTSISHYDSLNMFSAPLP